MSVMWLLFLFQFAQALTGTADLESKLLQSNSEIKSLENNLFSKQSFARSMRSSYLPSFDLVGGWQKNKTDSLSAEETGNVAYLHGVWNLFHGFKDVSQKNIAECEVREAEITLEQLKRKLNLKLKSILSEIAFLHQVENILNEELRLLQLQKLMASRKASAGLTGPVDNLEFELRESEIEIELKQIAQQHSASHQSLHSLLGSEFEDKEIVDLGFDSFENLTRDSHNLRLEDNLDYKNAQNNNEKQQFARRLESSSFLPSLNLTYEWGRLTPLENSTQKLNEYKYGLELRIPLFSGFETVNKFSAARSLEKSAEFKLQQAKLDFENNLSLLLTEFAEYKSLYSLNEIKLVKLQKYFELTRDEYKRGIKNSPDMVGAIDRLFAAKKNKFLLLNKLEVLNLQIKNLN